MESIVDAKGRVTIPKAVRDHLGLEAGDRVKYFIQPNGDVVVLPTLPITALRGMLARPGQRAISIEEMDAGIAAGIAKAHNG